MSVFKQELIVGTIGNVYDKRTVGRNNQSVIDFSIAVTPRKLNRTTNEWEDGKTYWEQVTAWDRLADNIEKSFKKGDRVVVVGSPDMQEESTYTVKNENGEEETRTRPARKYVIATYAGLEVSYNPAESHRENKSTTETKSETKPAAKKATSKPAPKAEPVKTDDDDDFLNDDIFSDKDDIFSDNDDEISF